MREEPPVEQLTEEERDAIAVLAERHRLMAVIVPPHVDDEFCKRLSVFVSYLLDIQMLPSLPVPARRVGNGLVCPFCGVPTRGRPTEFEKHKEDCEWRLALVRYAAGNLQVDHEAKH